MEGIVGKTTHRLEKAQRGIALIATALSQQKELLQGREQDLLEKESRVNHLEKQLADAKVRYVTISDSMNLSKTVFV